MANRKTTLAIFALIIANMIWGAAPPIFKWALNDIHPYTLAFLRFSIPALITFLFIRKKLYIHPKDRIKMILIGFFGITINIIFFFKGLINAPSINAALIGSSGPIFIVFFSLLFLKEKPKRRLIIGSLIGLSGVILVLITPFFIDGKLAVLGNFYYIVGMLGGIIALILARQILKRNNPITVTFWSFSIGSIGFLPFFLNEVGKYGFLPNITSHGIIGLLFGIFLSSLAAYHLQTYALKVLTAADVSVFAYMDPIVTILIAAPLLGELPDFAFVIGSILVILGIFKSEGRLHYHPFHLFLKK